MQYNGANIVSLTNGAGTTRQAHKLKKKKKESRHKPYTVHRN